MNTNENAHTTLALLEQLKMDLPDAWDQADVVGNWIWLEFNVPPDPAIRKKLKELGFHWNGRRKCWQNPCGLSTERSRTDPRSRYPTVPANAYALQDREMPHQSIAKEYKIIALKECPLPEHMQTCDRPDQVAEYWRLHIATNPYFNPECECFVVFFLNTRHKLKGHQLLTMGTLDTILIHPREVFRGAVIAAAASIIVAHNHPSGESAPSEADVRVTRDLIRAGQLMQIQLLDHVVVGREKHCSLRELGYFY